MALCILYLFLFNMSTFIYYAYYRINLRQEMYSCSCKIDLYNMYIVNVETVLIKLICFKKKEFWIEVRGFHTGSVRGVIYGFI